ncbi:hypothetical protein P280DRAFT_523591 [Massarina eburnea CBS 473.64]|uniref:DUF7730 domain-containing protein n=1 Tax=Massarina eburnea CBS 473.64 TaxID=1395130 RepID=A0A6A6RHG2_9PLEO|nr:hypothetical protein P280DRAFT_523591 [Massarina eburnea CBS 473.64]
MAPLKKELQTSLVKATTSSVKSEKNTLGRITKHATAATSSRHSARLEQKNWKIKRLENGLLGMETTPRYLEDVVKRNTAESPLLKLPSEIRNQIFEFAMAGECRVEISGTKLLKPTKDKKYRIRGRTFKMLENGEKCAVSSAFHLPQVCRQIYAETAPLGFAHKEFVFGSSSDTGFRLFALNGLDTLKHWAETLAPAHRNSVTDVKIQDVISYANYINTNRTDSIKDILPGLQRLHLPDAISKNPYAPRMVIKLAESAIPPDARSLPWVQSDWMNWLNGRFAQLAGEGVQQIATCPTGP